MAAAGFALLLPVNYASPLTSAAVLGFGAVSAWTGMTEQPAVFDFLLLALFLRLLRPRRPFHFTTLLQAAALEWLWANVHGTTAVLGVWLALLKAYKASIRTGSREERLGHWGLVGAVLLAFVCNPHGAALVAHTFRGGENFATSWQPLSVWLNLYNVFCLAGAASCVVVLQQEFVLSVAAATVLCLSVIVVPLRALAILATCPVISLALGHVLQPLDDDLPGLARWTAGMAALLGLHWLGVTLPLGPSRGYGVVSLKGATQFLKASRVQGRMFNEVDSGAQLIGAGDRPVFVDERAALYGDAFMRDAESWPSAFRSLAGVYGFDYAVLLNRRAGYPAKALDQAGDWVCAYADDTALVYVKRDGASGALVKDQPAPLLRPNELWPSVMDEALRREKDGGRVLQELDRWIVQAPDSAQALIWKAYALDRRGAPAEAERMLDLARARRKTYRDPELLAMLAFTLEARGDASAHRLYRRAALVARRRRDEPLSARLAARLGHGSQD